MIHPGIDKVIALLREAGEERFSMGIPCGSVCCVGGHCRNEMIKSCSDYGCEIDEALMDVSGIPNFDACQICFPSGVSGWRLNFDRSYDQITLTDAIAVLEHYRDTGIVDWSPVSQRLEREAV